MKDNEPLVEGNFMGFPVAVAYSYGINEALFLNQLHYWISRTNNKRDGYKWVYKTLEEWSNEFPFWSESTLKRTIKSLLNEQLIVTGTYNRMKLDRTLWYRINYEKLNECLKYPLGQNEQMEKVKMNKSSVQNEHIDEVNLTPTITIDYTKTNTENKTSIQLAEQFEKWWSLYGYKIGKAKCETKFKKLLKQYTYEEIETGTIRYQQYREHLRVTNQFVPQLKHPYTFLNGEHFNDEYNSNSSPTIAATTDRKPKEIVLSFD